MNARLGRYSTHPYWDLFLQNEWLCTAFCSNSACWIFLIGSDCVNTCCFVERWCFVLCYSRCRIQRWVWVCAWGSFRCPWLPNMRNINLLSHTGPALSSSHKDHTVLLLSQQAGWDGHRITPLWQVVLLFYLVQQWYEMNMETSAIDVFFSYANILNYTNRHWTLGHDGKK